MKPRCALLAALLPVLVLAKSYWYPSVRTSVELGPNGDARVVQDRTYYFDGSFSWAFVDLKKQGADDIRFLSISEQAGQGWRQLKPRELRDGPNSVYVEWGYSAEYEEKTFRLEYVVVGAVKRYEDVAEFYWKLIEDEHEPVEQCEIEVALPGPSAELFKVFVHSRAKPGALEFNEKMDRVSIEQAGIPKDAFVEVRLLAADRLFPRAAVIPGQRYKRILGEEQRNFLGSTLRVWLFLPLGVLLIVVVPVLLLLLFYSRWGREPKLDYEAIYEHEPPSNAPAFVVPALMVQRADGNAKPVEAFRGVFASLVELANKGAVSIEETEEAKGYRFVLKHPERLSRELPLSQAVGRLFFDEVSENKTSLTDRDFREYARKHAAAVRAKLSGWFDDAVGWWEKELGTSLVDPRSATARDTFIFLALVSVGLGVVSARFGLAPFFGTKGPESWVIPAILGVLVFVVLAAIARTVLRWTPRAFLEHTRWKRFRKFLCEFSAIEQAPVMLLAIWEQYYVYAVALGVAKEFLKNVGRLAQERGEAMVLPVWYAAASGAGPGQAASIASFQEAMHGLSSFAANFQSMAAAFSPSSSSGGGFSGGGGGGGGGGSSGAG